MEPHRRAPNQETSALARNSIRRFLLHVLPPGFQRIRYFGFLAARFRRQRLALCRKLLGMPEAAPDDPRPTDYRDRFETLTGRSRRDCPACGSGHMLVAGRFEPGDTPPLEDTS